MRSLPLLAALLFVTWPGAADARLSLHELRLMGHLPPAPTAFARPTQDVRDEVAVGDTRDLWTYDLSVMPPKNVSIASTCRGVGETVIVYVADDQWGTAVAQADIDGILLAFDAETPGPIEGGIMEANVGLFGEPTDVDGDPHLIVFIYEIPTYQGNAFDGFFRAEDLAPFQPGCESNPMSYCSNEAEMIHVDSSNPGSDYMIGVMAHEFQHLIHHAYDPNEHAWINEALSELAMAYSGYEDTAHVHAYLSQHNDPVVTTEFVHYGAVMLWGVYLYERFDADFIRALVAEPQDGIAGLDAVQAAAGELVPFAELFGDWASQVVMTQLGSEQGFTLLSLPELAPDGALPALVDGEALLQASVPAYGYRWFRGRLEADAGWLPSVRLESSGAGLAALVIGETGAEPLAAEDGAFTFPAHALGRDQALVLTNPTAQAMDVSARITLVEAPEDPVPEPQPDVDEPDLAADVPAEDQAGEDTLTETGEDAGGEDTQAGAELSDDGGSDGSCAMGAGARGASPALLLAALLMGLAVARRPRAAVRPLVRSRLR
jgi:hypothetical protein